MIIEPYIYASDMRSLEAQAVRDGVSYTKLMENAGSSAASFLLANDVVTEHSSVVILCGTGNNGGDGYVMASCLADAYPDQTLTVLAVGGLPKTDNARTMCDRISSRSNITFKMVDSIEAVDVCGEAFSKATVVVDAIYGIGFHGELPLLVSCVLEMFSRCNAHKVAVDIPSGMEADSGKVDIHTACMDTTLTFASKKRCMMLNESRRICGTICVCDIGISSDLIEMYRVLPMCLSEDYVSDGVPVRVQDSHKGTYGNVYVLSGSYGMAGAAMLCGMAALRCGIGLLHYCIPKSIYPIVASQVWEAVYHPMEETADGGVSHSEIDMVVTLTQSKTRGAFLCGPGLSRNRNTVSFLRELLPLLSLPLVVDADGLNAFIEHIDEWKVITDRGIPLVLTPHPAEAARLLCCTVQDIESDRIASARRLSLLTGAVVILKGHNTIVSDKNGRKVYINTVGCSGLAKGGSGDVLAGMVAAFVAQGVEPLKASCIAVYLHGFASQCASERLSETGMLPRDLIDELPVLLSKYEKRE